MSREPLNIFGGASSASQRAMWKRQVARQVVRCSDTLEVRSHYNRDLSELLIHVKQNAPKEDDQIAKISLPNGEQIHDISKLYQKRCKKEEQRRAHRFLRGTQSARQVTDGRHAIDPAVTLTNRINDTPDAYYNTDCGSKKTLTKGLEDGTNACASAFSSTRDRFASTAAYRSSTFASVVKEPYADPEAIGPGTYRAKKRSIEVKRKQVPTPSYVSRSSRFEEAKANVQAVLSGNPSAERAFVQAGERSVKGPLISPTPRFKSDIFPEQYVSSKQHQLQHDAPDRFYDISPSCKFTIDSAVKSSKFRCSTMQSRVHRLASEASMVHNIPALPILSSATKESVGPGSYNGLAQSPIRPTTQEGVSFVMMPQHLDRFGLPSSSVPFVEARFRRFAMDPQPPASPPPRNR